jgi:hypothetical protein
MTRKRTRIYGISLRATPWLKRLLLGIVQHEGFASEAFAVEAALREYAERRRIQPLPESALDRAATSQASPEGEKREG